MNPQSTWYINGCSKESWLQEKVVQQQLQKPQRFVSKFRTRFSVSFACERREETELRWIREYGYSMRQDPHDQDFVFQFGDSGGGGGASSVSYVEMNFKLTVTGRGKKQQLSEVANRFNKPARVRPSDVDAHLQAAICLSSRRRAATSSSSARSLSASTSPCGCALAMWL